LKKSRFSRFSENAKKVVFFSPRGVFLCTPENRPCFTAETQKMPLFAPLAKKGGSFLVKVTSKNRALLPASFFKKKVSGWKNVNF
jgi:hypothetical protein